MPISFFGHCPCRLYGLGYLPSSIFWPPVSKGCSSTFWPFCILYLELLSSWTCLNIQPHSGRYAKGFADIWGSKSTGRHHCLVVRFLYRRGRRVWNARWQLWHPYWWGWDFLHFCAVIVWAWWCKSTAVSFGAVGTPNFGWCKWGYPKSRIHCRASCVRTWNFPDYIQMVTSQVVLPTRNNRNPLMPTLMVCMMTRFFGKNKSLERKGFGYCPLPFSVDLRFTVPYVLTGLFLGPSFRQCSAHW